MLRNNADVRRCSYFELGLPVIEHVEDSVLEILCWMRSILNSLLISKERTRLCLIKLIPMVPMEHWIQKKILHFGDN